MVDLDPFGPFTDKWLLALVEGGSPRQLKAAEDEIVNEFRFKH